MPTISPSKTVDGLVGGVLSATVFGAVPWPISPFTIWQAGLMAFMIAILGFLGGLVMWAIKRDRGIKDWSHLIEGHGGMLDAWIRCAFRRPCSFTSRAIFSAKREEPAMAFGDIYDQTTRLPRFN